MHSANSRRRVAVAVVTGFLLLTTAVQAQAQPTPAAAAPDAASITSALEAVKADPNLATERTIKTLRWNSEPPPADPTAPAWLRWIGGLFQWFGQSTRVLVWCTVILLIGLAGVYIYRLLRARGGRIAEDTFVAPTHVQDLDIRPESLPDDVGAAARQLWDRGEHRAALSLLYRALLSRLAHEHAVPIRDSSTEGDCLALAVTHVTIQRHAYAAKLIAVWQRFVYGHASVPDASVHTLCDEFTILDRSSARETA